MTLQDENPISTLMEFAQQAIIGSAHYDFINYTDKAHNEYECICKVDAHTTRGFGTAKQKAKKDAASTMLSVLKQVGRLKKPPEKPIIEKLSKQSILTNENSISWLMEARQSKRIASLDYTYQYDPSQENGQYQCSCKVETHETVAFSASKKGAKLAVSEQMADLLIEKGYEIATDQAKSRHLVEPNACREWIYSICPEDVDIRRLSWYLENDCLLINLGLKQPNPEIVVSALKKQIEKKTNLLVLINRERDAKQAIDRLQSIAEDDGCIYDLKKINQIALGNYFKPREYPEPEINWHGRQDHTKDHCFTIDSKTSIDLDDAFSIAIEKHRMIVHIHIADVSNLVMESSKEEHKALKQCFTYYGASKQLPMLPNQLMYQASLLPHKDRMAWTVKMILTDDGEVSSYSIYPSVIRSKFRLDQKTVTQLVASTASQQSNDFKAMFAMSDQLIKHRLEKGGINDFIEENAGYQLVQEFMLLANRCVADFCIQKNILIPFRVHAFPDGAMDIKALYKHNKNPKALLPFLGRASYCVDPSPHEALAFKSYCHFTSPIRRYADLLVQYQLRRFYFAQPLQNKAVLAKKIQQVNHQEQKLEVSQTTIRYIERLEVQFRQTGKKLEAIVDEINSDYYILKPLSLKCSYRLQLPKSEACDHLHVGNTVFVKQISKFYVIDEMFECK